MILIKPPRRPHANIKHARRAIAEFVEQSLPRFSGWLDQVAHGIPKVDLDGNPIYNADGSVEWVVKPSPAEALKICTNLCEYHLPRLSRSEVSATVEHLPIDQQSSLALQQRVLESLGLTNDCGDIIDVEHVAVERIKSDQQPDVG